MILVQDWQEMAWIMMSLLIASALIISFLSLTNLGRVAVNNAYEDRRMTEQLLEYRKYNQYDDKVVRGQDIASLVLEVRGYPSVKIYNTTNNLIHQWTAPSNFSSAFTSTDIYTKVSKSKSYTSSVVKDANGALIEYRFKEM
ncbi:MAG: hypothetical protein LBS29_04245 [Endomicrobium sp.]|nr:hypothetical protein [Endomicrobium sp.]